MVRRGLGSVGSSGCGARFRAFIKISIGLSRTVEFGLIIETCDFCSSVGFAGVWFTADSVISERGGTLPLCDRDCESGETEGSGVGSEDFSGLGMAETRLLRGCAILFLLTAGAFCVGESGSPTKLAASSPSILASRCGVSGRDVLGSESSGPTDRRVFRGGSSELLGV